MRECPGVVTREPLLQLIPHGHSSFGCEIDYAPGTGLRLSNGLLTLIILPTLSTKWDEMSDGQGKRFFLCLLDFPR